MKLIATARLRMLAFFLSLPAAGCDDAATQATQPASTQPASTQPASMTGHWKWILDSPGGEMDYEADIVQDGDKLTGTITEHTDTTKNRISIHEGKIVGDEVTFVTRSPFGNVHTLVATYTGPSRATR